jgi:hypothetical protein
MAGGGSNKGERRGGRQTGVANKRTREIADRATAEGITPLEYMLQVLRDEMAERPRRDDMARAAAPYMHPRLNSTEVKVPDKIVHEVRIKIVGNDS